MEEYPHPLLVEGDWSTINAKTLQSKVHIYFQSRKKSQGGDCVIIGWSERSCTVLFKSQESELKSAYLQPTGDENVDLITENGEKNREKKLSVIIRYCKNDFSVVGEI